MTYQHKSLSAGHLPAQPGFNLLTVIEGDTGGAPEVWRDPVVGWELRRLTLTDAETYVRPLSVEEEASDRFVVIEYPNGSVLDEGANGAVYESAEQWLQARSASLKK